MNKKISCLYANLVLMHQSIKKSLSRNNIQRVSLVLYLLSGVSIAGTGAVNLEMSGVITGASCNISTSNGTQSVTLGDIQASTFSSVGETSSPKAFSIYLDDCTESISGGAVSFVGEADDIDQTLISLTNTGTQATGVAIQLLDNINNQISINTTTAIYALKPGNNVLQFYLRYKSTSTNVTPGDANAVLYFDMNYE